MLRLGSSRFIQIWWNFPYMERSARESWVSSPLGENGGLRASNLCEGFAEFSTLFLTKTRRTFAFLFLESLVLNLGFVFAARLFYST